MLDGILLEKGISKSIFSNISTWMHLTILFNWPMLQSVGLSILLPSSISQTLSVLLKDQTNIDIMSEICFPSNTNINLNYAKESRC